MDVQKIALKGMITMGGKGTHCELYGEFFRRNSGGLKRCDGR